MTKPEGAPMSNVGGHEQPASAEDGLAVIEELERQRDGLRSRARAVLGIEGKQAEAVAPLRETLAAAGVGWYPLAALSVLVVVDQFQATALFLLGPELTRALGISPGALALLIALKSLAAGLTTLPIAAIVQRRPVRAATAIIAAFAWSVVTLLTGLVTGLFALAIVLVIDGASTGSVQAVHKPLLLDNYPPEVRVRVLSVYQGADALGNIASLFAVLVLTTVAALTWRGVFVAMGVMSITGAVVAVRLRDPGLGHWDTARVRELVRTGKDRHEVSELEEQTELGFFEIVRRLMLIPSQRRILAGFAVLGMMLFPIQSFFAFFLDERWGMGPGGRVVLTMGTWAVALAALAIFGRRGEEIFRRDPARLMDLTAVLLVASVACFALGAVMPVFGLMVLFFLLAFALVPVLFPAFHIAALTIIPPVMRPHAQAMITIFTLGVGGVAGAVLLGSVERRFGVTGAIVSIAVPGIVAGFVLRSLRHTIIHDLDRMIDEVVEQEETQQLIAAGHVPPMLACKGIDFSYGQLQVLFDVDFTVDQGEMVALLGVNGAGKSTLLRTISGIGLPSRGSIRLHGVDITYLDPHRRTKLGIIQIPGGRAVFGPLSVVENIRLYGYTLDKGAARIDQAIEMAFDAFPRLAERRNQAAETLSGGEQQMLALTKALILKPRLLLIDELSLGLAPVIVAQLLDMVRSINATGTAVVLVEQSVNVALSLVDHAYFMEKGEIRFDGPAQEVLARKDLLRSVFLEGVARGGVA